MNDPTQRYYILLGQERSGPFELKDMESMAIEGQLSRDHLYWTHGLEGWHSIDAVLPELAGYLPPEVPLPPTTHILTTTHQSSLESHSQGLSMGPALDDVSSSQGLTRSSYLYISKRRLICMGIFTSGFYIFYWCYKNWDYLKKRDGTQISPLWRSIFCIYFIKDLFSAIKEDSYTNQILKAKFNDTMLYAVWLASVIVRFGASEMSSTSNVILMLPMISILVSIACLYPVQDYINQVNKLKSPELGYYPLLSRGHIIMFVIFGFIWFASILAFRAMMLN